MYFGGSAGRGELGRCALVERRVRSMVVVVAPPEVQLPACIGQVEEHLYVQAFVAQSPVEALDVAVLDRPAWTDEVQVHTVPIGPVVQCFTGELGAVVHSDRRCHCQLKIPHFVLFENSPV